MYADIEALVLSGELFNGPERSSSPVRTPSPDAGWHDDALSEDGDGEEEDYDSDAARRRNFDAKLRAQEREREAIGMGPGRTGVKGVIRDRDEAEQLGREKRERELGEKRAWMESASLGGKTYLEEEREKAARGEEKVDPLVFQERFDVFGLKRTGKFGYLREVGLGGFLTAVEEKSGIAVVVHIYDPSLERCYLLDDTLSKLARSYPDTKFLRSRASVLGFASTTSRNRLFQSSNTASSVRQIRVIDEDDPYDGLDDDQASFEEDDVEVDTDMLPTMLVYRDGQLVHNWVRVDWEAGRGTVEELLDKHNLLPRPQSLLGNTDLSSQDDNDDDGEILWSDEDV